LGHRADIRTVHVRVHTAIHIKIYGWALPWKSSKEPQNRVHNRQAVTNGNLIRAATSLSHDYNAHAPELNFFV